MTGRRAGSAGTPRPPGPAPAAATAVYCGRPAACPGCGWSVAVKTQTLNAHAVTSVSGSPARSQYLIEDLLQVWRAHALRYVSVGRVAQKELPLCCQSSFDVLLPVDVFLTAVDHPDVPCVIKRVSDSLNSNIPQNLCSKRFTGRQTEGKRLAISHEQECCQYTHHCKCDYRFMQQFNKQGHNIGESFLNESDF